MSHQLCRAWFWLNHDRIAYGGGGSRGSVSTSFGLCWHSGEFGRCSFVLEGACLRSHCQRQQVNSLLIRLCLVFSLDFGARRVNDRPLLDADPVILALRDLRFSRCWLQSFAQCFPASS